MKPRTVLVPRFQRKLERLLGPADAAAPPHLLVAFSGGLDSTVLLHLLRFRSSLPLRLTAAHFDHRMRPESGDDALWVRGLCSAWNVPLISSVADAPPANEAQARKKRYGFLREASLASGADWILTAHHADDQAETVLFRILRGTGPAGLRGIPQRTASGLLRPLLPFWREELRTYAEEADLRWREDRTNAGAGAARNRLRNTIIPQLEREIAPGARRSLVRLAKLAAQSEESWKARIDGARERIVREEGASFLVARHEIAGYDPETGARLIRDILRQLQSVPDRIGTRKILQFITDAASGRRMTAPGGVQIVTDFEVARFSVAAPGTPQTGDWLLTGAPTGKGHDGALWLDGVHFQVEAFVGPAESEGAGQDSWSFSAPLAEASFPLQLRGRRPGDRIRLPGGSRSVKKLLIDRRVPGSERGAVPVLVDSTARVLWVAGVATAASRSASPGEPVLNIALKR